MKYLHIFPNEKFTEPYIEFINKNFNSKDHLFFIIGKGIGTKITLRDNVKKLSKDFKSIICLFKNMYKCEKIFLHGLFFPQILILFMQPWLLKKSNWIIWGGDLYYYKFRKKNFKSNIYEYIRRQVIKRIGGITALTPGDCNIAKKWYKIKAKEYFGMYINPVKKEFLDKIEIIKKDEIYIQIGNSADPANNHFEILDMLEKFKNENIKIFAPLSYGDKQYALKVKQYGEEKFGDKFIAMLEFLSPEKYSKYLGSIDILVFNHKRQQGLFNIFSLAYLGKKIYIRNDITSWSYLKKDLGLDIYSTLKIKEESFNDFKLFTNQEINRKRTKKLFEDKYIKGVWLNIFNEMEEKDENINSHR
ncbi:MAG: hypothetical protein PWP68_1218 [Rikenellaceae bacterium]|nr:hypothetical protein [Rikenellaceae bacterium]